MPRRSEQLTTPVNVAYHEQRILLSPTRWEYPIEDEDPVQEQLQLVLETLHEASPYVRKVMHIQRTSHAYNAEVVVELQDGEIWELRVFSTQEELLAFREYLKKVWNVSTEEQLNKRQLIRQLFLVAVTPELKKQDLLSDFKAFVSLRYK